MRTSKYFALGLIFIVALSALLITIPSLAVEDAGNSQTDRKWNLVRFQAEIRHVSDLGVEVSSGVFNGTVLGVGKWIYIDTEIGRDRWKNIMDKVEEGDAYILMGVTERNGTRVHVLLALKQEGLLLLRPKFILRSVSEHRTGHMFFMIKGEVLRTGDNYLIVKARDNSFLLKIARNSTWTLAGNGDVTWSDIKTEFTPGDSVTIYFRKLIVFNDLFAEFTGFKFAGYGVGTVVDVSNGITITRP